MSHTPGPWRVGFEDLFPVVMAERYYIATMHGMPIGDHLANASLIAAAPELLEALKAVIAISDRKHDAWDAAKAAIAKAEGKS